MPTPIPIIAPMVVANSGIDITLDRTTASARPRPTPATATASGRPIAITEPNAKIRTTTANASPMNSDCGGSNSLSASPPISTDRPGSSGARSMNSPPSSDVWLKSSSGARSMRAKATCPSALTWGRPGMWGRCGACCGAGSGIGAVARYGLVTFTPSYASISSNIASMASRTAGSSMPASERKTTEPLKPPPRPPKCSSSTSNPLRLSESGASSCA